MSSALDMSLDDIIKNNKKSSGTGNPRRGGRGSGPTHRLPNRSATRPAPYFAAKVQETTWQHGMFAGLGMIGFGAQPGWASSIETGTKLYVSNLDYGVSNEDIKGLFSEVGDLKGYSIHYDRSGRSKGTAEIVFSHRADALAAVKRYNNVQLDGKLMKIEIVGTNIATPAAPVALAAPSVSFGIINGALQGVRGRVGVVGHPRGGASRGFGRGRGHRRGGRGEKISAEDLDADLEKYHLEAMETN